MLWHSALQRTWAWAWCNLLLPRMIDWCILPEISRYFFLWHLCDCTNIQIKSDHFMKFYSGTTVIESAFWLLMAWSFSTMPSPARVQTSVSVHFFFSCLIFNLGSAISKISWAVIDFMGKNVPNPWKNNKYCWSPQLFHVLGRHHLSIEMGGSISHQATVFT